MKSFSLKVRSIIGIIILVITLIAGLGTKEDFFFWPFIVYPMFSKLESNQQFTQILFFGLDENDNEVQINKSKIIAPFNEDTFGKILLNTIERKNKSDSIQYLTEIKNKLNQNSSQFKKIRIYSITQNHSQAVISKNLILESE